MTDSYSGQGYEVDVPAPAAPAPEPSPAPVVDSPEPAAPAVEPAPSPAPVETPAVVPPAEPANPEPVTPPADLPPPVPGTDDLYELPDGRKVTGAEVREEYTNLLSDYTKKAQELAALKGGETPPITQPADNIPEWQKPDFKVNSVAELVDIATREAEARILARQSQEIEHSTALATEVDNTIAELKATDPALNEALLFQHANKFGFRDLKLAHANMQEMGRIRTSTEEMVRNNLKLRESDPIAGAPSDPQPAVTELTPDATRNYSSALDYMQRNQT